MYISKLTSIQRKPVLTESKSIKNTPKDDAWKQSRYNPQLLTHDNVKICHFFKFI